MLTNSTDLARGNEAVMYERHTDGSLAFVSSHAIGGLGSGPAPTSSMFGVPIPATADGIGSQGSPILSRGANGDGDRLFAVNSGSDSMTCFQITPDDPSSRNTVSSGGCFPASLTVHGNFLYVLTTGGVGNIKGFEVHAECHLEELAKSTRSLAEVFATIEAPFPSPEPNDVLTTPAQISFTPDGGQLVIAFKGAPNGGIAVYKVRPDGRLSLNVDPRVNPFSVDNDTAGPFSFEFDDNGNLSLLDVDELGAQGIVAIFAQDDRNDRNSTLFGNHGIYLKAIQGSEGAFVYAVQPRVGKR